LFAALRSCSPGAGLVTPSTSSGAFWVTAFVSSGMPSIHTVYVSIVTCEPYRSVPYTAVPQPNSPGRRGSYVIRLTCHYSTNWMKLDQTQYRIARAGICRSCSIEAHAGFRVWFSFLAPSKTRNLTATDYLRLPKYSMRFKVRSVLYWRSSCGRCCLRATYAGPDTTMPSRR
jgi:hypothetical protein